jgi:hypothetical protein
MIVLEFRIDQVRELARPAVNLDDVRPFHLAELGSATAFVYPQQWLKRIEGASVNVQVIRKEFPHCRSLGRLVDGICVSCLEKQLIGFAASP